MGAEAPVSETSSKRMMYSLAVTERSPEDIIGAICMIMSLGPKVVMGRFRGGSGTDTESLRVAKAVP